MPIDPNNIKAVADFLPQSSKELLFNPASDAIGQAVGGILYWVFQKPIKLGIIKRAEFDDLSNRVSKKLDEIPEEQRADDKLGLMIKTLENARYSLDEESLRECFANLLANTANKTMNYNVSPLFPMILGNMTRRDAQFISLFKDVPALSIANIVLSPSPSLVQQKNELSGLTSKYKADMIISHRYKTSTEIDKYDSQLNLFESFGIITKTYDSHIPGSDKDFESINKFNNLKFIEHALQQQPISDRQFDTATLEKGRVVLTALGPMFIKCVLS